MKKICMILFSVCTLLTGYGAKGQSLKDLLNKDNIKKAVETVADKLDVLPENITGTWEYTGAAVKFTSDNVLMSAASELAAGQVEDKLDEYLQKAGLRQGTFSYVFETDSTFTTVFNKMKFPGTYRFSPEADTIELDYGKSERLKGFTIKTQVTVGINSMELLFNADRIIEFIGKISSSSGDTKLKALSSLISQYDGLKIGFGLTKVQD